MAKLIVGKNNVPKNNTKNGNTNKKSSKNKRPTYKKSSSVIAAEKAVNKWEKNKPDEYKSKYSQEIDKLLKNILNREKFEYNMNADPMYQQYRENYIQDGKKAMMDTIGQATALTGGYLNSYASSVGNQVYDEYLNEINDIALDLRDRAYEQYTDEGDKLLEDVTILRSLDGDAYDKYWDSVQRYYKDGEYLVDKLVSMSDAEFDAFLAQVEAWEEDRAFDFEKQKENNDKKQFKEEMAFKKQEAERNQANKDREYALAVRKAQQAAQNKTKTKTRTSSTKKSTGTSKSKTSSTKGAPVTYKEFYDRTGISSILTEGEFYSSPSVRKKYSTYQKYLKEMYERYG